MPDNIAFLFPGQGSQYCGMGKDLHAAHPIVRDTYAEAGDTLGYDIAELSFNDPDNRIDLTRFTQPVLLTHSIACWRLFNRLSGHRIQPRIAAGHSLGEYSALVCAGALDFASALALVKMRGQLMGEFGEGEMEALMLELEPATQLAEQHYCAIAACNLPGQTVVGGKPQDLDALTQTMAGKFPRHRSVRLKTEGAFHTYYMVEAARRFRDILHTTAFAPPQISVLSNFTGRAHSSDAAAIRSRLFLQLFNPVLWYKNLLTAGEQCTEAYIEFGGGLGKGDAAAKRPALEGMVKQAFRSATPRPACYAVINQATLEQTIEALT